MVQATTTKRQSRRNSQIRFLILGVVFLFATLTTEMNNATFGQAQFRIPTIGQPRTIGGETIQIESPFRSVSNSQETTRNGLQSISKPRSNQSELQGNPFSGNSFSGMNQSQLELLRPRFETITEGEMASPANQSLSGYDQPQDSNLSNEFQYRQSNDSPMIPGRDDLEREQLEVLPPELTDIPEQTSDDGHEEIKQFYPDGKIRIRRFVKKDEEGNYVKDGPWIYYDQSERVIAAGRYRNSIMHGQWQRIHTQDEGGMFVTKPFTLFPGAFQSVANFNRGKLDGAWTISDQYRRKIFEVSYHNGTRHGLATWWYPGGLKMRQATFNMGLLDGPITDWDENQKVVGTQDYFKGRKLVRNTSYYRPRVRKSEEQFLEAKLEPNGDDNWWEAKPAPYAPVGSRIQDGPSMEWYENGQRKKRGSYRNDIEVGTFTWWHPNGSRQIEGRYVAGLKQGVWTWWHESGMKHIEGTYRDGEPAGIWRAWLADGKLRNQENFSLKEPQGSNRKEPASEKDENGDTSDESVQPEAGDSPAVPTAEELPKPESSQTDNEVDDGTDPLGSTEDITPMEFEDTSEQLESIDPEPQTNSSENKNA